MRQVFAELPVALWRELAELNLSGPKARQANLACLAVGIAVFLALALRLADPWWAGISGYMCTQASQPQSFRKGMLRVAGTLVGALVGYVFTPLAVYDPAATLLLLFLAGTVSIIGAVLSPHGYAWLLGGITAIMVTLGALDDPTQTLPIAFYRTANIVLGTATAGLVVWCLGPPGDAAVPAAPGWRSLLGANWHVLSHGMRTGVAIAAVPLVWRELELPNLSQMAISIGAVMAVPALRGVPNQDQTAITRRAAERATGCALGGFAALLILGSPLSQMFLSWMLLLMAGSWVAMQVQTGRHGISGVGAQAAVALILTLVQGWGQPAGLMPAIDKVAGMFGAIGLLLLINLLLGPPLRKHRQGSDVDVLGAS